MLKRILSSLTGAIVIASFVPALAYAAPVNVNLTITPTSTVYDGNHVVGVLADAAPGYSNSSLRSDGVAKTDMYFTPESLFSRQVTLGDVASISYWTKKGSTHTVTPADWFLNIYTKPYAGQLPTSSSWYGTRIGTEPYFASNLSDPANSWNKWATSAATNQLRFYESTYGYFGSYTDPDFATFKAGTSLTGARGPGVAYATQPILYFSPQTSSNDAATFTGQIDGLRIQLSDGSIANINFEADNTAPYTHQDCKNGGYATYTVETFKNQGKCIKYVNDHDYRVRGNNITYTAYSTMPRHATFDMNTASQSGFFHYVDDPARIPGQPAHTKYTAKISAVNVDGDFAYFAGKVTDSSVPAFVGNWVFVKVQKGATQNIWGSFTDQTSALNGVQNKSNPADGPFAVTSGTIHIDQ